MKVTYLTNVPSPYTIDFLNELGKQVDLRVIFERASSSERDASWQDFKFKNFEGKILKGLPIGKDTAFSPQILFRIGRRHKDILIIGNPLTPTGILTILWLKLMRRHYVIISEGGIPGTGKGFKEGLKRLILKNATLYLSGAKLGDDYFKMYGAKSENIVRYPFASFYQADLLSNVPTLEERAQLKKDLRLTQPKMVLFVGRFIPSKGIEVLLKASQGLINVDFVFIGGKATQTYQELVETLQLKHVYFIPFVAKEVLTHYYQAADLFVLPTFIDTYGLVVNEAMSYGLPVITTNQCVAGVELIEEGVNGYLVPVQAVEPLHEAVKSLLENDALRQTMAEKNLEKIKHHTIESMAAVVYQHLTTLK